MSERKPTLHEFDHADILAARTKMVYNTVNEVLVQIHNNLLEELYAAPDCSEFYFVLQGYPDDVIGLVIKSLQESWQVEYNHDERRLVLELPKVMSECPDFTGNATQPSVVQPL